MDLLTGCFWDWPDTLEKQNLGSRGPGVFEVLRVLEPGKQGRVFPGAVRSDLTRSLLKQLVRSLGGSGECDAGVLGGRSRKDSCGQTERIALTQDPGRRPRIYIYICLHV